MINRSLRRALAAAAVALAVVPALAHAESSPGVVCDPQPLTFGQTPIISTPIVIEAPNRPIWRIVPPSSDPDSAQRRMPIVTTLYGMVLCSSDDLLLVQPPAGGANATVRVPSGRSASLVPPGSEIEATGLTRPDGGVDSVRITILPEDFSGL